MTSVLMVCDPKESRFSLLKRAITVSKLHNAKLHVLDLLYVKGMADLAEVSESRRDAAKAELIRQRELEIRTAMDQCGIDREESLIHIAWGKDLTHAVLDYCKKIDPVLVVKRATSKNKQVFHTPTDWHLIQYCPAPLLISPMKAFRKKPTIMVALDLATKIKSKLLLNHRLMAAAKRFADASGAELHAACCVVVNPVLAELDMIEPIEEKRKMKEKVKPLLSEFQRDYGLDPKNIHFKTGTPFKVLNSLAQQLKADVVVVGAAGRKGVKGHLLGSTAEQMLQHLYTDMLLIKP